MRTPTISPEVPPVNAKATITARRENSCPRSARPRTLFVSSPVSGLVDTESEDRGMRSPTKRRSLPPIPTLPPLRTPPSPPTAGYAPWTPVDGDAHPNCWDGQPSTTPASCPIRDVLSPHNPHCFQLAEQPMRFPYQFLCRWAIPTIRFLHPSDNGINRRANTGVVHDDNHLVGVGRRRHQIRGKQRNPVCQRLNRQVPIVSERAALSRRLRKVVRIIPIKNRSRFAWLKFHYRLWRPSSMRRIRSSVFCSRELRRSGS